MPFLSELKNGESGIVRSIDGNNSLVQRLYEMGLTEGECIEYVASAPLGDPIEFRIRGYLLSLRRMEAACILVDIESMGTPENAND